MALDALELGVIALMGIAVFIWGPEKVPEIAKQIATARKEIDVYTKQLQGITKELQTSMSTGNLDNLSGVLTSVGGPMARSPPVAEIANATAAAATVAAVTAPVVVPPVPSTSVPSSIVKSGDQLLLEMARKLGISTQGKTRDDIQNEILARASQPEEEAQPMPAAPAEPQAAAPAVAPPASAA
jgi:Sec-independent protein translocase protein TatA